MVRKVIRRVLLKGELAAFLLEASKDVHPDEFLALLKGKEMGQDIVIEDLELAPSSTYGRFFSDFRLDLLPIDFSMVGIAHSHPSGNPNPSVEDMNNMLGKIMMIVTAPYSGFDNIVAYDGRGRRLPVEII